MRPEPTCKATGRVTGDATDSTAHCRPYVGSMIDRLDHLSFLLGVVGGVTLVRTILRSRQAEA